MAEAFRDLKLSWLKKLKKGTPEFDNLLKELSAELSGHLPFLLLKLDLFDDSDGEADKANIVLETCDEIISLVDTSRLALFFGVFHDSGDEGLKAKTQEFTAQKEALIEAYFRKIQTLSNYEDQASSEVVVPPKTKAKKDKERKDKDKDKDKEKDREVTSPIKTGTGENETAAAHDGEAAAASADDIQLMITTEPGQDAEPRSPETRGTGANEPDQPLSSLYHPPSPVGLQGASKYAAQIEDLWELLKSWCDVNSDPRFLGLKIRTEMKKKHLGTVLKLTQKLLGSSGVKQAVQEKLEKQRLDIVQSLGWTLYYANEQKLTVLKSPPDYLPF